MRRTSVIDLLGPFVVAGGLGFLLFNRYYESFPRLQFVVALPIAALAIIEFVTARRVRAAVLHRPDAQPMTALAIARSLALAKSSTLVAAGLTGLVVALLLRVLPDAGTVDAARHDAYVSAAWLVASVALLIAALLLERAAVDPNRDRRPESL
ncbi:MAG: hypothetical protein JWM76_3143 [Pseudonocardiales bacterium]|nr:hypothetical protein [Pseudonocardiales bacterium]